MYRIHQPLNILDGTIGWPWQLMVSFVSVKARQNLNRMSRVRKTIIQKNRDSPKFFFFFTFEDMGQQTTSESWSLECLGCIVKER